MFLEKNNLAVAERTGEAKDAMYRLIRSYVEYECNLSRTFNKPQDVEREVEYRLTKIFS